MMYSFERHNRLLTVALYHYFLGHEQE
jgi:hypothetical protein